MVLIALMVCVFTEFLNLRSWDVFLNFVFDRLLLFLSLTQKLSEQKAGQILETV